MSAFHEEARTLSREELLWELKCLRGQQLPSGKLGSLIAAIQSQNPDAPPPPASSVAARRTFVDDWRKEHADEIDYATQPPSPPRAPPAMEQPPQYSARGSAEGPDVGESDEAYEHRRQQLQMQRQQQMNQMQRRRLEQQQQQQQQQDSGQHDGDGGGGGGAPRPGALPISAILEAVRQALANGATEQQLHALASAIAVATDYPLPPDSTANALAEYTIDFYNFARHSQRPVPPPVPRPGERKASVGSGADTTAVVGQMTRQNEQLAAKLAQQAQQMAAMQKQLQEQVSSQMAQAQQQNAGMMQQLAQSVSQQLAQQGQALSKVMSSQNIQRGPSPRMRQHPGSPEEVQPTGYSQQQQMQAQQQMQRQQQMQMQAQQEVPPPSSGGGKQMEDDKFAGNAMKEFLTGGGGPPPNPDAILTPRNNEGMLGILHSHLGGDPDANVPLATLNELTRHVATMSKKAAPKLMVQKRTFVKNYYEDLMAQHGRGGAGVGGSGGSPDHGRGSAPLNAEAVFREVDARLTQAARSVTGSGELADVHVDGLAEKISTIIGQPTPVQKRERRNLIDRWHRHVKSQIQGR